MAAASWAHIHSYKDSSAAIAGAFCPNKFDATSDATWARFAATIAGCTVAASASSNTDTAARARPAAPSAWAADVLSHPMYDAAASTIAADADPCHHPTTNPDVTDPNDIAAQCSSEARSSQAAAAANIGADPAPANTLAELTSGGSTAKFGSIATVLPQPRRHTFIRCANKQPRSRMKVRTDPERGGQTPLCIGATITVPPTGAGAP
ncbi:Uncharacterised protein [Mycobacterium tuberculosis]|uniref:Uncharacterized protein n=2 Tax=Mycobacterium tuberculosis TaxID=1773 RepID=A0A0U0RC77_MYCTX|nr:Uncharacterised protein [Mycobacterium tuberculosis]CFR80863.1 Uncharacterised protein [Mycobacterium tuberculosis]CKO27444.1 Uncharacterised protein [Mycobacterium tuberculosis]CKS35265.1 Uncharacterised protein [Mycobacterium tuberculosis]CKU98872.1 Uncharacterised protein [Mycobacterium tuberculosis]